MKIHSRLFLFIAILVLAYPALILACGGEEPNGSTPAVGSRTTGAPGATGKGGDTNILGGPGGMDRGRAEGEIASISAGREHTCGLRVDGSVACWGYNDDGRATMGRPRRRRGSSHQLAPARPTPAV